MAAGGGPGGKAEGPGGPGQASARGEQPPVDPLWDLMGPSLSPRHPPGSDSGLLNLSIRSLRKFILGLLLLVILLALPRPDALTYRAQASIALFAFIVFLWITEALPLPVTALLAGVGLVLLGVKDSSTDAFMLYAQDTFFFILGSLILADGITKSGADRVLAGRILSRLGRNTWSLLLAIIVTCSTLSMFISDHAVAAVMLPVGLAVLRTSNARDVPRFGAALMIAIGFGAVIAGLATPSGGARNAIVLGYMREIYDVKVGYLDWVLHAMPITLVLIPIVFLAIVGVLRIPLRRLEHVELHATRLNPNQKAAFLIFLVTIALWITVGTTIGLGTVAIIGSVLMFLAGTLDWEDTRKTIPWGVAFVYGAALAMGQVLDETGAAGFIASNILSVIPTGEILLVLLGVILLTVFLSNFMSDGATVAVVGPVTLGVAALLGTSAGPLNVESLGIATAVASAFNFILVISTPAIIIVHASGQFTPRQMALVGIPVLLAAVAILVAAVLWYWPMLP